jgi:hypothetical protein
MRLGQCSFERISGPVSITVLQPTALLREKIGHFTPILMLIGDYHEQTDTMCEPKELQSLDVLSMYSPVWLRLLDSIATFSLPVRYFVEANFPVELLNTSKYLVEERKPWMYEIDNNTIMTYTAKHHPECYSKNSVIQQSCITSNMSYEFADLRLGITFAKLTPEDAQEMQQSGITISEIVAPRTSGRSPVLIKRVVKTRSRKAQQYIYKQTESTYESVMYQTFKNCLTKSRPLDVHKRIMINGVSILKIIKMLFSSPLKVIKLLYDPLSSTEDVLRVQIQQTSKMFKAMQATSADMTDLLQLFYQYFVYVMRHDSELRNCKQVLMDAILNYEEDTNILHRMKHRRIPRRNSNDLDEDELLARAEEMSLKARLKQYEEACDTLAATMFLPFNDMFYLFSTWSPKEYSSLSVYHCGDDHCSHLFEFLTSEQLYKGWSMYSLDEQDNKLQCIDVSNSVQIFAGHPDTIDSIDAMIQQNILHASDLDMDTKQDFVTKQYIIKNRVRVLGLVQYKRMLSGQLLPKQQLLQLCTQHQLSEKQCKQQLDLSDANVVFVPSEYLSKLKI